jgi:hypothetical protein
MGKVRMAMVDVSTGSMYYYLNERLESIPFLVENIGVA